MQQTENRTNRWPRALLGVAVIACLGLAALSIETAARLISHTLARFGAELPVPAALTIQAAQIYMFWIVAASASLIIVYLGLRASAYFLHACIVGAVAAATMMSLATLSLVSPMAVCADYWPAWQGQPASGSTGSQGATSVRGASKVSGATSCR